MEDVGGLTCRTWSRRWGVTQRSPKSVSKAACLTPLFPPARSTWGVMECAVGGRRGSSTQSQRCYKSSSVRVGKGKGKGRLMAGVESAAEMLKVATYPWVEAVVAQEIAPTIKNANDAVALRERIGMMAGSLGAAISPAPLWR